MLLNVPARNFLPKLALALALGLPLGLPLAADAAAPMLKTQAPGWFRMMLGDFEVTALSDGTVLLPIDKLLDHADPDEVKRGFAAAFLSPPIETSVNGFLINTGAKLVLVDTGAGKLFGPTLGNLLANLRASGYAPEQVDEIYLTHMHGDHIGGLLAAGQIAFPNAIVRADKREAAQWLSQANMDAAPAERKDSFKGAMASVNPYVDAGHFRSFDGDTELVPGVRARASYGHTLGHTSYVVESGGQKLVLIGDLMHVAALQFGDPAVSIAFDTDGKSALAERRKAFDAAAKGGYWIGGAHLSFPGIGHLRASGAGYVFVPVNYTALRN